MSRCLALEKANVEINLCVLLVYRFLSLLGVMENVLSLYPGQSWDTSILPVLSSYGEPFMDAVCRDSCDGHDVGRVSLLHRINT